MGPGARFTKSHAVVIAVDAYRRGIPALQNAVRDCLDIGRSLGVDHGFDVRALFDQHATAASIRRLVAEELPAQIGPNDRLLVYVASHGLTVPSDDGPNGYLLFHDAARDIPGTFFPMRELHDALAALKCRHLMLVLDCCFAATFRWAAKRDIVVAKRVFRETFDRYVDSPAWQVMTSAASDQRALDVFGERRGGGHSPFAQAFLDGLAGKADLDQDGLVTATELYLYTRGEVERATGGPSLQTPGLFPLRRHERGEFVFQVPDRPLRLEPAPQLTPELNPYRGLESFDEATRDLFFGRERVVRQLARAVLSHPLTAVVGPSGCGKSSIVKAGLVPMFRGREGATRAGRRWSVVGPVRALDAVTQLSREPLPDGNVLVVIDQLEDVLTQSLADKDRAALLGLLAGWTTLQRVRVVVTVRSDYEPQLQRGDWSEAWRRGRFAVPAMSQDQLRRAIEEPAAARELYFRPTQIIDDLINEVVQMPGALPLLSFTLSELYRHFFERRGEDRAITDEDVDAIGGVTRALTLRATSELEELSKQDPQVRETAARVMLRMVATASSEPARRRVPLDELVFANGEESNRAKRLVDALVRARLLVTASEKDGFAYVEPAHDGLIRGWDRLEIWRKQHEQTLPLVRALGVAATNWDAKKREPGYLWNGDPRLAQAVALARGTAHPLNLLESTFVSKSEQRRRRRSRTFGAIVAAVIAVLLVAMLITVRERDHANAQFTRAEQQRANALIELAPSLSDPLQGALVLAEIEDQSPVQWKASLAARRLANETLPLSVQNPSGNEITQLSIHASGQYALARDTTGNAWLLVTSGRRTPVPLRNGSGIADARFGYDVGSHALVVNEQGAGTLWAIDKQSVVAQLQGPDARSSSSALTSERAVIAYVTGLVRVFELDKSGSTVSHQDFAFGPTDSLHVSADATRAVSIRVDDTTNQVKVRAVALEPGAQIVEVGSFTLGEMYAGDSYVPAAFLSDDGETLTVYADGRTRRTWNLRLMELVIEGDREPRRPHVSDDSGRCFAGSSRTGNVDLWGQCGDQRLVAEDQPRDDRDDEDVDGYYARLDSAPAPVAFGKNNVARRSYVLVGRRDGTALLWEQGRSSRTEPRLVRQYRRHGSAISAVALLPDVELLATGSRDGEIRIWSIEDQIASDMLAPLFFTDGHRIVASTYAGAMGSLLGAIGSEREPETIPGSERSQAHSAWFTGDKRHFVVEYDSGKICSYTIEPLRLEGCCEGRGLTTHATRSPDASLWVGLADGSVRSCDVSSGKLAERSSGAEAPAVEKRIVGFAFDNRGVIAVSGGGVLSRIGKNATPEPLPTNDAVIAAVGEETNIIATVTKHGDVQTHSKDDDWKPRRLGRHIGAVSHLVVTGDGSGVLSCTFGSACYLWAVDMPERRQVFWPRGKFAGMSRDGNIVVTADKSSFLVWSPAQPGMPIELARPELRGEAVSAHLSDNGKHLVGIWSDPQIGMDRVIPLERMGIWRMDWREIVRDLRSKTTACLDARSRVAYLDEKPEDARRAHERCVARHGYGSLPIPLLSHIPQAPPSEPRRKRNHAATADRPPSGGVFMHVTIDYDKTKRGFTSPFEEDRRPSADEVAPVWSALLAEVKRLEGVRLDAGATRFEGTFWTPSALDLPALDRYRWIAAAARADIAPWSAQRYRIILQCRTSDGEERVALLTVPLGYGDIVDRDAATRGRPAVPAQRLIDLHAFACAGVSTAYPTPLRPDGIDNFDGIPGFDEIAKNVRQRTPSPTTPAALDALVARVAGLEGKITPEVFTTIFGHPPFEDERDEP